MVSLGITLIEGALKTTLFRSIPTMGAKHWLELGEGSLIGIYWANTHYLIHELFFLLVMVYIPTQMFADCSIRTYNGFTQK